MKRRSLFNKSKMQISEIEKDYLALILLFRTNSIHD